MTIHTQYILSIDQGTTGTTASIVDHDGNIYCKSYKEITQYYPNPGWVEHDPLEIYDSVLTTVKDVIAKSGISINQILGIGITNQRETTIVWDKNSGKPIYNAIVWQCRRTTDICEFISKDNNRPNIKNITGLPLDPYFSATKIKWILEQIPDAIQKSKLGHLLFGTVDSWLIWNLTGGKKHVTDVSNASRTMLFDIQKLQWDAQILDYLSIPLNMMPEIIESSGYVAMTAPNHAIPYEIPICGIAGDQQSSLFGQCCHYPGMAKVTYGTGAFILNNTGESIIRSECGLISTVGWKINGKVTYVIEGAVFSAGATVQWLRDEMKIIKTSSDIELFASKVEDNGGVYLVPAFTGLGAPYWDMRARGTISGLTRGSNRYHLARACLESIAFQANDIFQLMETETGHMLSEVRVDGGASDNNLLMQFQSDITNRFFYKSKTTESTSLGAAFLAGLALGYWDSLESINDVWSFKSKYQPSMDSEYRLKLLNNWNKAISRSKNWEQE